VRRALRGFGAEREPALREMQEDAGQHPRHNELGDQGQHVEADAAALVRPLRLPANGLQPLLGQHGVPDAAEHEARHGRGDHNQVVTETADGVPIEWRVAQARKTD
jgi:hypothetical protein